MEPQFKSSFIPKKDSVVTAVGNGSVPYKPSSKGLLDRLAVGLFVIALLIWAGLFGYQKYVEADIVKLEQSIANARSSINQDKVDLFVALGKQVKLSKELLDQHISLTPLFEFLEENTIPTVQFTDFDFSLGEKGEVVVEAVGKGRTFADVTRQEEVLRDSGLLSELEVNGVTVGESVTKGGVTFNVLFSIPRQSVLYVELVKDLIEEETVSEVGSQQKTIDNENVDFGDTEVMLDEELNQINQELESF